MNENKNSEQWVFRPEVTAPLSVKNEQQFLSGNYLFTTILDSIQDGVSVLNTSLDIKYLNASMKYWHGLDEKNLDKKCYKVYHGRRTPCQDCPTLKSIHTKEPHMSLVSFTKESRDMGWQQVYAIPILNAEGEVILVLEYVRDVTFQKSMEKTLSNLESRFSSLEEQNNILLSALGQMQIEKEQLETTIETNVEKFIKPSLDVLKRKVDGKDVDVVSGIIDQICYPVTKKRTAKLAVLSPREKEVAVLIKDGKSSKEIAEMLIITKKAVDYHRQNIRKKLGLTRSDNLRNYLEINL